MQPASSAILSQKLEKFCMNPIWLSLDKYQANSPIKYFQANGRVSKSGIGKLGSITKCCNSNSLTFKFLGVDSVPFIEILFKVSLTLNEAEFRIDLLVYVGFVNIVFSVIYFNFYFVLNYTFIYRFVEFLYF